MSDLNLQVTLTAVASAITLLPSRPAATLPAPL